MVYVIVPESSFEASHKVKTTYLWVVDFLVLLVTFATVTVGRGCLPNLVGDGTVENRLKCKLNTYIILRGIYNPLVGV